jgi:hypothetical protein
MTMNRTLSVAFAAFAALGLAAVVARPAEANTLTFTFAPSGAGTPLTGPGSTFTADAMAIGNYIYASHQSDLTFTIHQFFPVTGFTLNGAPVTAPGFGSAYGLYFEVNGSGTEPAGSVHYSTLDIALRADPGNHNGALAATVAGVGFANLGATGAADDVTLATGSLSSASLAFDPATGVRKAHYDQTFIPVAGQGGFFATPAFDGSVLLDVLLTTNPDTFMVVPGSNGASVNFVNGAFGTAQFVPEPGSIVLLVTGVLGLGLHRSGFVRDLWRGAAPPT